MCEVCARKAKVIDVLRPFLKDGVVATFQSFNEDGEKVCKSSGDGWDDLTLTLDGKTIELTADGDEGGYFHWKDM